MSKSKISFIITKENTKVIASSDDCDMIQEWSEIKNTPVETILQALLQSLVHIPCKEINLNDKP